MSLYCQHCGIPMRLINGARSRILLFWCPSCHRFAEASSSGPRPTSLPETIRSA